MSDKTETAAKNAPAQPKRLGRGLGALLGEARREEPVIRLNPVAPENRDAPATISTRDNDGLANLPVSAIEPHPEQPRRHFDPEALAELAASIGARGVIQPVIVRPLFGGRFQLVAGERRWRAAQQAQLHEIPALIRDLGDRDVMALALIENIQREDLNPIEEARAYQRLAESEGLTQAEIAGMVDKSRSHVANIQRLLSLPEVVIAHLETGRLSMGHARALIGHERAEELANEAVAKKLSVREIEQLARKKPPLPPKEYKSAISPASEDADIRAVESHLEEFLGLPVKIAADADTRSGAVTIRYRTLDQLDLICQRLTGGAI